MSIDTHVGQGTSPPLDHVARTLPIEEVPDFLAMLAKSTAIATLRLHTPTVAPTVEAVDDTWITAAQVGVLFNMPTTHVRRTAAFAPYRKKTGRRTTRYNRAALLRFMKRAS